MIDWATYKVEDTELKRYGYAPGNYACFCITCKQQFHDVDKGSIRCRECATGLHGLTGGAK